LRSYTSGAAKVSCEPGTLREVITSLEAAHRGTGGRLLDDGGKLRRFVNAHVNEEDDRFAGGLLALAPEGAHVSIIPAVAGGA
jgi:molybdopterin converting factor small subunit